VISVSRVFDKRLVKKYIDANGLDPVPFEEPHSVALEGVQLTVETYSWGRACYAEWPSRNVAVTWLEHGDRPGLPEWAEKIRKLIDRPVCLGLHVADHTCDGGRNPETGERERACTWKGVCLYVQAMVKGDETAIPGMLAQYTVDELWERSGAKAEPEAVRRPTKAETRARAATKAERRAQLEERRTENLEAGRALARRIVDRLMELGDWELSEKRWRTTIGQFCLGEYPRKDRPPTIVLYRRRPRSWSGALKFRDHTTEQAICRFIPQFSAPYVTVQIKTNALDLVREACPSFRVGTATKVKGDELADLVTVNAVDEEGVNEVADAIYQAIASDRLLSWGKGAVDPDHPRPRKNGRFGRRPRIGAGET
jgi:hypothetical protein